MQIDNRIRRIAAVGVFAAGLALTGCDRTSGDAPPAQAALPEVAVVTVEPQRVVLSAELPARTAAHLIAEVRPQVGGIIQERLFTEGADVNEGDMLYRIDPALYQAAYDNAVAALSRSEANLPPIQSKVTRFEEAVAAKAISRQAYDEAVAALNQVKADIEYGQAAVQAAQINLGYTRVTAPISGRIGRSSVTVGALVSAHQPVPLAIIQQLDPIYVDASQSSANLLRLKQNMAAGRIKSGGADQARVRLRLEDGTPYPLEGTLKFSEATVDPSTGSFILRMVFPNPDHVLLPGMYVRVVIEEGVVEQAILAPQQGVSRDHKGNPQAMVVDAEGKARQQMITVDRAIGDTWLVTSGLAPGDRVIVEGLQKVRPGSAVKAVPLAAEGGEGPKAQSTSQPAAKS
ncbi:MAG: efflux RND transporter periplasmic adaptor subunit [Phycisphaerae bacterium]|nr:efflux RND transporter periplasmic adaptor subunit [Phycisphaerae bacterium]